MHSWLIVMIMALTTIAIRFAPFIIFKNRTPSFILYLGKVLPMAAMGMLVVYCLRDVSFNDKGAYLPALISSLVAIITYRWKHSTGLSILSSTIIYMVLVQNFFA